MRTLALAPLVVVVALAGCRKEPAPAPESTAPAPAPVAEPAPAPAPRTASASLTSRDDLAITGTVTFSESGDGVEIQAHVENAPAGPHGFHIHEVGDCSAADFTSAGGHFNPADVPHGGPDDMERHAGDLGNIEIGEDGTGHLTMSSELLTVAEGPVSVVGRAVVLHETADDLVSQPTGAAGARLACGVIAADS